MLGRLRPRIRRYLLPLVPFAGERFDRKAGVETEGHAALSDLTIGDASRTEGFLYVPTPPQLARAWLDALEGPLHPFTLVDMGSGRGRVLLIASEKPFRRVIGVEFAVELHEAALENIRRFPNARMRCKDVTSVLKDAAAFSFPTDPLVVYFNNPFSEVVMTKVVRNLATTYEEQPRPIVVVYQQLVVEAPEHSTDNLRLLDRQPFLEGRTIRFSRRDQRALEPFLVRMYSSPEARSRSSL